MSGMFTIFSIAIQVMTSYSEFPTSIFSRMGLSNYLVIAAQLIIAVYFIKRLYSFVLRKGKIIDLGSDGSMTGVQKVATFFLNTGFLILGLATCAMAAALVLIQGEGLSGVPFGLALILVGLSFLLTIVMMELGNFLNRKKVNLEIKLKE